MEEPRHAEIADWITRGSAGFTNVRRTAHDLVPEVPRAFERPLQGRLPLYRIGWALIRPQPAQTAPGK